MRTDSKVAVRTGVVNLDGAVFAVSNLAQRPPDGVHWRERTMAVTAASGVPCHAGRWVCTALVSIPQMPSSSPRSMAMRCSALPVEFA